MRPLLIVALCAGIASANGRAPLTNGVFFKPGDTQSIYIRTTFGLLISHDDGCTFNWVCEQAVGYGGVFDPKYAMTADGTMFATTYSGLRVSHDDGCSFTTATANAAPNDPGNISQLWIDSIDIGPTGDVWVGTAESGKPNNVYRSTDTGATFVPRNLSSPTIFWKSIKVAQSMGSRIYAAGYELTGNDPDAGTVPMAHLYRSDDDGDTWTHLPLFGERRDPPTIKFGSTPTVYIMGIDPNNPDILLLDSLAAKLPAGDRLYRSSDAGQTFTEVLATTDTIRDVVFRDSQHVLVATVAGGSYESTDGGVTYTQLVGAPQLACLGERGDHELIGCGANWVPDYKAVTRTMDATSWQPVWRFVNLAGPLACPAASDEQTMCAPLYPALQQQFGATGPACGAAAVPDGAPPDATPSAVPAKAGCCDAGSGAPLPLAVIVCLLLLRRRR